MKITIPQAAETIALEEARLISEEIQIYLGQRARRGHTMPDTKLRRLLGELHTALRKEDTRS